MTHPTKHDRSLARNNPLTVGFYKQQRDSVVKENRSLRNQVKHLERKLAAAKQRLQWLAGAL